MIIFPHEMLFHFFGIILCLVTFKSFFIGLRTVKSRKIKTIPTWNSFNTQETRSTPWRYELNIWNFTKNLDILILR